MLTGVFPSLSVKPEILSIRHELWSDLDPQDFLLAVKDFCKTGEIYPGTNIVAQIRDRAAKFRDMRLNSHKIAERRQDYRAEEGAIPMPEWFKQKLDELGKKVSVH